MTPNTRQRKSRLAENHSNFIEGLNLTNHEDVVDVILLSMKKLGLYEKLHFAVRTENSDTIEKRGRKMTSFETRKKVWDFYHQNSTPSTITSRPAKLKVSERHKIQVGLDFVDTVTIIIQRKKQFYENNWMMLHITYYELFLKYNEIHPNNQVSNGTFRVLKPFYVRTETEKDVEMCCCKLHLHARWAIEALINCAAKQNINIQITDYKSFFDILTTNCEKDETAYINWTCTPDKNTYCENIKENWKIISDNLVESSAHNVCVTLTTFEEVEYTKKNGEISSKLKPVSKQSSMVQIVEFISSILSRILHHRNHLKHYRSAVSAFRASFDAVFLDIDFSENLKLPVKFEPQSMHWCHETITVHSGIIKIHGEKSYHPYVSDDKKHDQTFVKKVLKEMIATIECLPQSCIVESDNCSSQYKSAKHFEDLQEICDEIGIPLIRLFSIAGHGKGEVDHVGGLAKCSIRRFVGTGGKVFNAKDCKDYLISKFGDKSNPSIFVKELQQDELSNLRAEARLKQYPTIDGSDSFQVIVFKPNSRSFKAAPRLCTCNICLIEYGSCSLFTEYQLLTYPLNKIYLRSDVVESNHEENDSNTSEEFILPGSYCAVAPDSSSQDSLWFIKIVDTVETNVEITDDYGNRIAPGLSCIEGRFLEKVEASAKGFLFKLSKKKTYFFRESVVYPFVQFTMAKKGYHLSTMEYVEILNYVESNGLSRI